VNTLNAGNLCRTVKLLALPPSTLKSILEELDSSLAQVLKVDVHLASASDFYKFEFIWREFFPSDPPARLTIEVGDTFPIPGALINLDAVAIVSDSKFKREGIVRPAGAEPDGSRMGAGCSTV
jgi:hypothetical protein